MNKVLDFLNWHKKKYGHAYNHQNDLIATAKKSTLYAEYYHQSKVNGISDEQIEIEFRYDNTNDSVIGAKWLKNELLKQ